MDRPFTLFLVFAAVLLIFGNRLLSADNFKVALGAVALIFFGFWIYGVIHMPAAISEQFGKSHHPDLDVRALQDGEISLSEYAERKAARQCEGTNASLTHRIENNHQQSKSVE